jgi:hypothetical protein
MMKNKDVTLKTSCFLTVSKRKKAKRNERITDVFQSSYFYEEGIKNFLAAITEVANGGLRKRYIMSFRI